MLARYGRNLHCLSGKEVEFLSSCTVAVIGCGGLGGYLIEYLGRLGIGEIIAADGDSFDESNLNRQLLCEPSCLGQGKAEAARRRMASVNPELRFTALPVRIGTENGAGLLEGSDLIMDAVDSIPARFALEEIAERMGIPLVHGAVAGWYGQVASIYPGDRTMEEIYAGSLGGRSQGIEDRLGNLSFGPAIVAGLQAAEAVKILLGRDAVLRRKILFMDFLSDDFEVVELFPASSQASSGYPSSVTAGPRSGSSLAKRPPRLA